jgi:heptosyltransferase III
MILKEKILISMRGALGDTLCLTGCLEDFRAIHPEAHIAVFSLYPDLFRHNPYVDEIASEPSWSQTPSVVRDMLNRAPWLKAVASKLKYKLLHARGGTNQVLEIDWEFMYHNRAMHLQDTIRLQLGIPAEDKRQNPELFLTGKEIRETIQKFSLELNKPFVAFSTDAGWQSRQWPESHWNQLIDRLVASGHLLVRLGRDNERSISQKVAGNYLDLTNMTSVRETAVLVQAASLLLSVDSGMFHVAAAVNTEAIGLFGPVNPELRIYSYNSRGLISTTTDCVACSTTQDLRGVDGHCPTGTFECMSTINVDAVYTECKKYIERPKLSC